MMNAIWRGWVGGGASEVGGAADPSPGVVDGGGGGFDDGGEVGCGEEGELRFRIREGMNLENACVFVGGGAGCGTPMGRAGIG